MASKTSNASGSGADAPSKSGIVTDSSGQRHIPSSVRADGTKRKEIKIRPGYRPPEDAEVYRSRGAEAFRARGKGAGVPGADVVEKTGSAASNKNAKRKEARRKAKEAAGEDGLNGKEGGEGEKEDKKKADADAEADLKPEEEDPEIERQRKGRRLRKKLREARALQQKKDRGEGLLPDQLQKAIRINELIRELEQMGLSVEEEAKEDK